LLFYRPLICIKDLASPFLSTDPTIITTEDGKTTEVKANKAAAINKKVWNSVLVVWICLWLHLFICYVNCACCMSV